MTKSVTSALIGILVRQKKLAVEAPAPVAAWSDPKDPRHAITIDNLLRMTSGIEFAQSLYADWRSAFDPSAHPHDHPSVRLNLSAQPTIYVMIQSIAWRRCAFRGLRLPP